MTAPPRSGVNTRSQPLCRSSTTEAIHNAHLGLQCVNVGALTLAVQVGGQPISQQSPLPLLLLHRQRLELALRQLAVHSRARGGGVGVGTRGLFGCWTRAGDVTGAGTEGESTGDGAEIGAHQQGCFSVMATCRRDKPELCGGVREGGGGGWSEE
jgi:hypothetical protein